MQANFLQKKNSDPNINEKMKTGFANFLESLDLYLQQDNITFTSKDKVIIYGLITLKNSIIIRVTNSFHNKSWFSNVFVHMNFEELFDLEL